MEDGRILDHQITAYYSYSAKTGRSRGRLGLTGKYGAWSGYGWLQTDLGDVAKVTKVATQGRYDADEWVRRYFIRYSIDGVHCPFYRDYMSYYKVRHNHIYCFIRPVNSRAFITCTGGAWYAGTSYKIQRV